MVGQDSLFPEGGLDFEESAHAPAGVSSSYGRAHGAEVATSKNPFACAPWPDRAPRRKALYPIQKRESHHWRRGAIAATSVLTLPPFEISQLKTKPRLAAASNQACRALLDQHPLPRAVVSTPRCPRFCRRLVVTRPPGTLARICTGRGEPYSRARLGLSCQSDKPREPLGSSSAGAPRRRILPRRCEERSRIGN